MYEPNKSTLVNNIIADFQKGERLSSFQKLQELVDNYPEDEITRYNFAVMSEQLNYIDLAIDNYKKITKNNPKNWRSKFSLYLIYINQKKYDPALQLINEVLKICIMLVTLKA